MNKKLTALFFAILLIGYCGSIYAQPRIMKPTSGIVWECFQPRVSWLTMAPPYRGDMSLGCFLGYYYFDSLMRATTGYKQLDTLMWQINSLDTLGPFLRYLYTLTDYDAILFRQFLNEGYFANPAYPFNPMGVYNDLQSRINLICGATSKTRFLVNCGPILHIIADNVSLTPHNSHSRPDSIHTFGCVWAHVLDTIKGKHFMSADCFDGYRAKKGQQQPLGTGTACINFSYGTQFQRGNPSNDVIDIQLDSLGVPLPCTTCYGDSAVVTGGEYIVALIPWPLGRDSISDFYNYIPFAPYEQEGGIFPVIGGMVQDPSNFFGYGTSLPIATFESDLKADIETILSY